MVSSFLGSRSRSSSRDGLIAGTREDVADGRTLDTTRVGSILLDMDFGGLLTLLKLDEVIRVGSIDSTDFSEEDGALVA